MTPASTPLPQSTSAGSASRQRTLADARPNERVLVDTVAGGSELRRRLLELGFVSGTLIRVVRLAPLGDPMEVQLHGTHLSIRRRDAAAVLLRAE